MMESFKQYLESLNDMQPLWGTIDKDRAKIELAKTQSVPPIQEISTPVLLRLLRVVQYKLIDSDRVNPYLVAKDGYFGSRNMWGLHQKGYSEQEIRAELATREHIPNKKEARALRQQQARAQQNR